MRIIAIGDIHGCLRALDVLLEAIRPRPQDLIITLGDYINKGPDSKGVIDRLLELHRKRQLIPIKGNHELLLLQARASAEQAAEWSELYGKETLASYAPLGKKGSFKDIPKAHWHFWEHSCLDWWETKDCFFVHANVDPHLSLEEQSNERLFWEKFAAPLPHISGKKMICGHTSQKNGRPINLGHAICIDTWACGKGWLTGLEVNTGRIWQANQKGQLKQSLIEDYHQDTACPSLSA